MSKSSSDKADLPTAVNGRDPESPVGDRTSGAAAEPDGHARGGPDTRALNRRLGQELDYRLRSLHTVQTGDVPVTSARVDHGKRHRHRLLLTAAIFVAVAGLAVLLLQTFVVQAFAVPGDSMTPTLQTGDRILVLKSGVLFGSIERGDVIVFHAPKSPTCSMAGGRAGDLVLRVVALPGEAIWSAADAIFVDGRPLRERGWHDRRFGQVGSTPIRRTTLGADRYFVLADNRSDACDSRAFGPVSKSSIVGEGIAIVGRGGHVSFRTL